MTQNWRNSFFQETSFPQLGVDQNNLGRKINMNKQSKCRALCTLITAGFVVGVFTSINDAIAKLSEIDGFEQAVAAGSVEEVLGFIDDFPSSHLVIDLIGLVPPEVAMRVCASLPEGAGSLARRACNRLQEAIDLAPSAGGSTSEGPAVKETSAQNRTAALIGSKVNDEYKGSGDKKNFLTADPTNDTSTDSTSSARRDGMPAGDSADDATDGTTSAAADDTTDTADADDTAESEVDNNSTRTGNPNHEGANVAPAETNRDRGTGGSNDSGAEKGGGRR